MAANLFNVSSKVQDNLRADREKLEKKFIYVADKKLNCSFWTAKRVYLRHLEPECINVWNENIETENVNIYCTAAAVSHIHI